MCIELKTEIWIQPLSNVLSAMVWLERSPMKLVAGFNSQLGHTKHLKMVSAASLALTLNIRVAQRIKKQSVDYTSAKFKLIQSWRYKTLAVIKRHRNHLTLSLSRQTM